LPSVSTFAQGLRHLISKRINELINETETIAEMKIDLDYKQRLLDKKIEAIEWNMNLFTEVFKAPEGQKMELLDNIKKLYRLQ